MSDTTRSRLSWLFVALIGVSAMAALYSVPPVGASDDHDTAKALRMAGDILPLSELLSREELAGMRVLEAELEREDGRLVYELELLDPAGRVQEHYYDAATGERLDWRD
jgi:uncharacterized membrane protein YkoI